MSKVSWLLLLLHLLLILLLLLRLVPLLFPLLLPLLFLLFLLLLLLLLLLLSLLLLLLSLLLLLLPLLFFRFSSSIIFSFSFLLLFSFSFLLSVFSFSFSPSSILRIFLHITRKDWKEGLHKTECPQLKAASQRIKTAYGSFDAAEVAVRIHRAAEAVSCREEALAHTNSASPYATPGAEVHLISKVVLPSASVAAELAEDAKYATAREKLRLEVKEGRWFVDVLSYFFDGRLGVLKERYLNRNLADQFLLAVIGACDAKKMHFANDRAAQDYLTVVRANLSTIRMIMRDADERLMDALETLFYGLHWMEVQALMVAGKGLIWCRGINGIVCGRSGRRKVVCLAFLIFFFLRLQRVTRHALIFFCTESRPAFCHVLPTPMSPVTSQRSRQVPRKCLRRRGGSFPRGRGCLGSYGADFRFRW